MMTDVNTKAQWRAAIRARLQTLTAKERLAASRRVAARLRRLPEYRRALWILFYLAADGEVETRPMIRRALADGKRVAVPITLTTRRMIQLAELTSLPPRRGGLPRGLVRGPYGIAQPDPRRARRVDPSRLDLAIIPGVAFDAEGYRLGRGGGYFDRFLARLPRSVPRLGLAFRGQRVPRLPRSPHDQPVHQVLVA